MADQNSNVNNPWYDVSTADTSLKDLLSTYETLNTNITNQVKALSTDADNLQPGEFLQLQVAVSQLAQVGETISNVLGQLCSIIKTSIQNQRTG